MKTFLLLILCAQCIYGQGIIKGFVTDSLSMDQLKGAEIILTGTNFNAVSNTDGEFNITGIPAGEYILQTSYFGYEEKKILVAIKPEKVLALNIELLPVITIGNKTSLTDQAKSQAQEINLQVSSNAIENVIAGKKLQDLTDENIPVTLSRSPGVSIMYNSTPIFFPPTPTGGIGTTGNLDFISPPLGDITLPEDLVARVLIRGLDSRYYNVTLNGVRIPPTSAIDKDINMNNLSERNFQNIEVHKTITSDEDADATAGTINMITGKAPYKRMIKVELLGNYNRLDKSYNQHNFIGSYSERFFNDKLGVRVDANIEKKIMSNEFQNTYDNFMYLTYSYTSAIRERNGVNVLLDYITPDGGSIKFHNIFNKTNTDNFKSEADSSFGFLAPAVEFRNRETEQKVFLSSLEGNNYILGLNIDWNVAFSESRHNHPYDYSLRFDESFDPYTGVLQNRYLSNHALNIPTKNYSKERTVSLDLHKKYALSNEITGELKLGGKYRINSRSYLENSHLVTKYGIRISHFQDKPPREYSGFGSYSIPLMNKDIVHSWSQSTFSKFVSNEGADINSYNLSQSVSAGYIMHTLNFRGLAIFITGLRIENEQNDYSGYYFRDLITDPSGEKPSQVTLYNSLPEKTRTFHYNKTAILPNLQMILKPTDFMNLRLAAYKTLIRPASIARMPKYIAISTGTVPFLTYLNMGNPDLKNADVWNYEFQAQFHGNDIGQFTIDAFYKDIEGMVQATNGILLADSNAVKSFGINWRNYVSHFPRNASIYGSIFNLFSYFNSSKPTRVWGFEVAHQANLKYLPGLLKNIILNYNFTFLRSESWIKDASAIYTSKWKTILKDREQKLSDIPEFFANVNLGYDINGFSFRISYFYQDEYPMYDNSLSPYNPLDISQVKRNRFSRLDIAVRQRILKNILINLSLNNITNSKEEALIKNPPESYPPRQNWEPAQAYRYGMNIDFGVGIDL